MFTNNLEQGESQPLGIDGQQIQLKEQQLLTKLELLTATAALRRIDLVLFAELLRDCQMSWEVLFRQYVGKNVLNFSARIMATKKVPTSRSGPMAAKITNTW